MSENYRKREEMRDRCFAEGRCYANVYRGGIKEYICLHDKHPCMFQCLILSGYDPPGSVEKVNISEGDYKVE